MTDPVAARPDVPAWVLEPRGPHLPDAVTRVPVLVWPFVVLSLLTAWSWWDHVDLDGLGAFDVVRWAIIESPSFLAPLIGAALFLRHPDARRSLPMLAVGAALLGIDAVLHLAHPLLTDALAAIAPPADDMALANGPLATWYGVLAPLVLTFAVVCLARGLASARRFEDHGSSRWLVVSAGVLAGAMLLSYIPALVDLGASDQSEYLAAWIASAVFGLLGVGAWVYLAVTALAGRRANEEPALGWSLAIAAAMISLAATAITFGLFIVATALGGYWEPGTLAGDASIAVLTLASFAQALSWALLIAAFLVGLPSVGGPGLAGDATT